MKRFIFLVILLALLVTPAFALSIKNYTDLTCGNTSPLWGIEKQFDGSTSTYYYADGVCQAQVRVCFPSVSVVERASIYQNWVTWSPRTYRFNINTSTSGAQDKVVTAGSYNSIDFSPDFNTTPGQCMYVWMADGVSYNTSELQFFGYNATYDDGLIVADFTATPTSGAASLYVQFDDNSTGVDITSWNWSISPATGVIGSYGVTRNHSASFATPGNYTVTHCAADNYTHSDCEVKSNYITVYNATSDYITTGFAAMDATPAWYQLAGANIYLNDVENGSWVNYTPSATGYEEITTLSNHTINAYADMAGYSDADLLAQPAWDGGTYTLLMYPTNMTNVSAGNVTLYVNVHGSDYVLRLKDATVNIAYMYGGSQYNDYAVTGDSGVVTFVVPNQTTVYLYAWKSGYDNGGTTVDTGSGSGGDDSVSADITLQKSTVTPTATATTGPGGTIPITEDPYPCDADHPENCTRKQTELATTLIGYADDLLILFIVATIVGVMKMMGK